MIKCGFEVLLGKKPTIMGTILAKVLFLEGLVVELGKKKA